MNPEARPDPRFSWIELFVFVSVIAVLASIFLPVFGRLRGPSRRFIDASNIRQIAQAALIYANDNGDQLPELSLNEVGEIVDGGTTPNLHAIAAALAGGFDESPWLLNDATIRVSREDRHPDINHRDLHTIITSRSPRTLQSHFARSPLSFQFVAGLDIGMPVTTPIAFTRGLQPEGTWAKDSDISVYGRDRGHMVFLGGNVRFLREEGGQLKAVDGESTANLLETIDKSQRIFSYPETPTGAVDGTPGIGKRPSRTK